jgi:hypothetical protein
MKGVKKVRKLATLFLLIVSFGLLLAGAVSAEDASVDVTVIDQNGDPVIVANPGDEVGVVVEASANDETVSLPAVFMEVDPLTGLQFELDEAMMWDGTQWILNDPNDPTKYFFYASQAHPGDWEWNIRLITGDMQPGDELELLVPAIVSETGDISVDANLWGGPYLFASDSYTFLSVEPSDNTASANAATVPMQSTGAPVAVAMLGILSIIGGTIYSRLI